VDQGTICPQVVLPYQAIAFFSLSEEILKAMGGVAIVHDAAGSTKVPITTVKVAQDEAKLLAGGESSGGGRMPFPFRFAKLLETGRGEDLAVLAADVTSRHTATGYSNAFSFEDAFKDAIANLPPDTNPFPDKLINVTVVDIGANFGGIAGLDRMFVTVASFY
jgi:hypothetical protein